MSRIHSIADVSTGLIRETTVAVVYQCLDRMASLRGVPLRLRDDEVRNSIAVQVDRNVTLIEGVEIGSIEQSRWQGHRRSFCEVAVAIV